jgi:hypothetical protein
VRWRIVGWTTEESVNLTNTGLTLADLEREGWLWNFGTHRVTENTELFPVWSRLFTVTFIDNANPAHTDAIDDVFVVVGDTIPLNMIDLNISDDLWYRIVGWRMGGRTIIYDISDLDTTVGLWREDDIVTVQDIENINFFINGNLILSPIWIPLYTINFSTHPHQDNIVNVPPIPSERVAPGERIPFPADRTYNLVGLNFPGIQLWRIAGWSYKNSFIIPDIGNPPIVDIDGFWRTDRIFLPSYFESDTSFVDGRVLNLAPIWDHVR